MECDVREVLREFMKIQVMLNHIFTDDIESIYEELAEQDEVNETVTNLLTAMTKRMNDIESRLNKLEKESKRNASNK